MIGAYETYDEKKIIISDTCCSKIKFKEKVKVVFSVGGDQLTAIDN